MDFEWDENKSKSNQGKHGISFEEAKRLWEDVGLTVLPSRFPDDDRFLAIGTIESIHWTAIFTERGSEIRIISVRRARHNERQLYEQHQPR